MARLKCKPIFTFFLVLFVIFIAGCSMGNGDSYSSLKKERQEHKIIEQSTKQEMGVNGFSNILLIPNTNIQVGSLRFKFNNYFSKVVAFNVNNKKYYLDDGSIDDKNSIYINKRIGYGVSKNYFVLPVYTSKYKTDIITDYYIILFQYKNDKIDIVDTIHSSSYDKESKKAVEIIPQFKDSGGINVLEDINNDGMADFRLVYGDIQDLLVSISEHGLLIKSNNNSNKYNSKDIDALNNKFHQGTMELKQCSNQESADKIQWPEFSYSKYLDERELIKSFYSQDLKEIEEGKYGEVKKVDIAISLSDINGDGRQEIFAVIFHPYFSGGAANGALGIFDVKNNELIQYGSLIPVNILISETGKQDDLGFIDVAKGKWGRLVIGNYRWHWDSNDFSILK